MTRCFFPSPTYGDSPRIAYITWDPETLEYKEVSYDGAMLRTTIETETMERWIHIVLVQNRTWVEGIDIGL